MVTQTHATTSTAADGVRAAAVVRGLVNHCISCRDLPISTVEIYRRDVRVRKRLPDGVEVAKHGMGGLRGIVTEFSSQSRFRLLHFVKNASVDFRSMLTLTYPADFPADGRTVKKHLLSMIKRLRRAWPQICGVWFLEFQKRGAPHFHVLLSLDLGKLGPIINKVRHGRGGAPRPFQTVEHVQNRLSRDWFEIVGSHDPKHLKAGVGVEVITNEDGALRYAACHAAKPHQKKVPQEFLNVGRFWGSFGELAPVARQICACTAEQIFTACGVDAMSRKGRVKKYLWDAADLIESCLATDSQPDKASLR